MNYSYIIKWLGSRSWEEIDEADNKADHGGRFKIIKKRNNKP